MGGGARPDRCWTCRCRRRVGGPAGTLPLRLVDAWLAHPAVRPFIRVNAWDGVEWFHRESFGTSCWRGWPGLSGSWDRAGRGCGGRSGRRVARPALERKLADGAETTGYRVDRLREAPAARGPGAPGAAPARRGGPATSVRTRRGTGAARRLGQRPRASPVPGLPPATAVPIAGGASRSPTPARRQAAAAGGDRRRSAAKRHVDSPGRRSSGPLLRPVRRPSRSTGVAARAATAARRTPGSTCRLTGRRAPGGRGAQVARRRPDGTFAPALARPGPAVTLTALASCALPVHFATSTPRRASRPSRTTPGRRRCARSRGAAARASPAGHPRFDPCGPSGWSAAASSRPVALRREWLRHPLVARTRQERGLEAGSGADGQSDWRPAGSRTGGRRCAPQADRLPPCRLQSAAPPRRSLARRALLSRRRAGSGAGSGWAARRGR